jgi:Uma2 family endonuclease
MVLTTTGRIDWETFEKIPDDGMHREIIEGEILVLPPPKSKHVLIAHNTYEALRPLQERKFGNVFIEAGYKLSSHPATWIQPDVSVLTVERVASFDPDGYFHDGPELAIEVVSPSETARDLNRKIDLLLVSGTLAIWVIFPDQQEVRVFLPGGDSFVRDIRGALTVPEPFGSLEISVSRLFGNV